MQLEIKICNNLRDHTVPTMAGGVQEGWGEGVRPYAMLAES